MVKRIDISTPNYPNMFTVVDDEDFDKLKVFKWTARARFNTFYAVRRRHKRELPGSRLIYLHREVMAAEVGIPVDHIDGDGMNNTRSNLRTCTIQQNGQNSRKTKKPKSSKFKGVNFHKRDRVYRARITVCGRKTELGTFRNEIDAAKAYNQAATEHFGEFARLNELPA